MKKFGYILLLVISSVSGILFMLLFNKLDTTRFFDHFRFHILFLIGGIIQLFIIFLGVKNKLLNIKGWRCIASVGFIIISYLIYIMSAFFTLAFQFSYLMKNFN